MSVLRRLLRRLLRPTKLYSFNYRGGQILYDEPHDSTSVSEENEESRVFENMLTEGMTIVDVGAHLGYYALIAAKGVGKTGRVYAFEPNPTNYRILVKNVKLNGYDNVVTVKKAVSNINGKVKLYIDAAGSDTSSLTKSIIKAIKDEVIVDSTTLDAFLAQSAKPDMIKIDAEGAEGLIIEGAMKTLSNCQPKIIMEFWPFALKQAGTDPSELLSRLRRLGFTSKLIDVRGLDSDKTTGLSVEDMAKHLETSRGFMNILLEKNKPVLGLVQSSSHT